MDISVVIPAFGESRKIGGDIRAAAEFLASNHFKGQIIVVDDGSKDGTSEVARSVGSGFEEGIEVEVIRYSEHRGKGYAVRTGISKSKGEYVLLADSGCCVPYDRVLTGLELIKTSRCDIAHGSRRLADSRIIKPQSLYRRFCARLFQWFIKFVMKVNSGITDSQCGFKVYRGDVARDLYSRCITDGFIFDVEIILMAQKQGYRIEEFPIEWTCDRDSRLSPSRSLWRIVCELVKIKRLV